MSESDGTVHPPVDFRCFEQQDGTVAERWLEFFEGEDGSPIWSVTLGAIRNGDAGPIFVKTLARDRFDELMVGDTGPSAEREIAYDTVRGLVNFSMAGGLDADPRSSLTYEQLTSARITEFIFEQAGLFDTWGTSTVQVDGAETSCSVWSFAGWRCALVTRLPDRYLITYSPLSVAAPESVTSLESLTDYELPPGRRVRFYPAMAGRQNLRHWQWPTEPAMHADLYRLVTSSS